MGRKPCCSKEGVNRGAWSAGEDEILVEYIKKHGEGRWRDLPKRAGLRRCGKSCRLRWLNYLRPDIKRGNISSDEEDLIVRLHKLLGNRWSLIAGRLPGRTDNEIKNYWNTNLSKRTHGHSSKENKNQEKTSCGGRSNAALTLQKKPSESQQQAIRTKAVRCTKVFLQSGQQGQMISAVAAESDSSFQILECPPLLDNENELNFLTDFDVEELLASDVIDSEFLQGNYAEEGTNDIAISEDDGETDVSVHPLPLDEDMVPDWKVEGEKVWWTFFLDEE